MKAWIITGSTLAVIAIITGMLYIKWLYNVPAVAQELASIHDDGDPTQATIDDFEGLLYTYLRTTGASPRSVGKLTIEAKEYYDSVDFRDKTGPDDMTLGEVCQTIYNMVPPDSTFTLKEKQEMFLGVFAGKELEGLTTIDEP